MSNDNLCKTVVEIKFLMESHDKIFNKNKNAMIDSIEICNEGGSSILKDSLKIHLPEMLNLLSNLVKHDNKKTLIKFNSQAHNIVPSIITKMTSDSRRDYGFRLCHKTSMHVTIPKISIKE